MRSAELELEIERATTLGLPKNSVNQSKTIAGAVRKVFAGASLRQFSTLPWQCPSR